MTSDLDHAYLINGDDLRIALAQRQWTLTKAATPLGGGDFVGRLKMPEEVVRAILDDAGKSLDDSRWPMTRSELEARLIIALDGKDILIDRDPAPGGKRQYVQAMNPAGLAAELVKHIDKQGAEQDAEPEPCPFHLGNGALGECNCELKKYALAPPAKPIVLHIGDEELSAIGCILAALEDLAPGAVDRVLRYVAHRHGVETS